MTEVLTDLEEHHAVATGEDLSRADVSVERLERGPERPMDQGRGRAPAFVCADHRGGAGRALPLHEGIDERRGHPRLIGEQHDDGIDVARGADAGAQRGRLTRGVLGIAYHARATGPRDREDLVGAMTDDEDHVVAARCARGVDRVLHEGSAAERRGELAAAEAP